MLLSPQSLTDSTLMRGIAVTLTGLLFIFGFYYAALLSGILGGLRLPGRSGWFLVSVAFICLVTATLTALIGFPCVWWRFFLGET